LIPLLPLILTWLAGAVLLLLDGRKRWVIAVAMSGLLAAFVLDAAMLARLTAGGEDPFVVTTGGWPAGVGIRLQVDGLAALFSTVSAAVLCIVLLHEARSGVRSRTFPALIVLLGAGLHGAFFTGDLFNFYVFFEVSVVTSFALASYGSGRAEIRGTFVYVALNLFGSVLFLMGVAAVYHATGALDFEQITAVSRGDPSALWLPGVLLFTSLSLKLGLFPFHGWVPVLYSHARPAVVAAFAGALVNIGAYGLLRFGHTWLSFERSSASWFLVLLGGLTATYGALLSANRKTTRRGIAYGAVVHAGYIVLTLGVGGELGIAATLWLVVAGALDKSALFLCLDAHGKWRRRAFLIGAASVAGLPITVGFVAKLHLFRAAWSAPLHWAALAFVTTSSVLMLSMVYRFWRLECRDVPVQRRRTLTAASVAIAIVALGVLAAPVDRVIREVAAELARSSI
jgi:multicomponent Na+:H+ antiporter subunit D